MRRTPKKSRAKKVLNQTANAWPSVFPFPRMDPLTLLTDGMRFQFTSTSAIHLTAPWGLAFGGVTMSALRNRAVSLGLSYPSFDPPTPQGRLVLMMQGHCWFDAGEHGGGLALGGADIVVVTRDVPFKLCDSLGTPVKPLHESAGREQFEHGRGINYGGGGVASSAIVGTFFLEGQQDNPLLSSLPPVICFRGSDPASAPWVECLATLIDNELLGMALGSQTVINHLAHVLFVKAVRAHSATFSSEASGGWLRAVLHPELARALALMHMYPHEPWTVASLAEHSNTSRSAFAARFTDTLGRPPLQYLTECRVRIAKSLLRETRLGIKTISTRVGYASESAFGHAFRRITGMAPGAYREPGAADFPKDSTKSGK